MFENKFTTLDFENHEWTHSPARWRSYFIGVTFSPYNKSFIDPAWGQDGCILAKFFFCVFMDLDFVSVHKKAKKEVGEYATILT